MSQKQSLQEAEKAWDRIRCFNAKREEIEQIRIDYEFRRIMVNDGWTKITDYGRKKYIEALAWLNTYSPNTTPRGSVDKTAMFAAGSGAVAGALPTLHNP